MNKSCPFLYYFIFTIEKDSLLNPVGSIVMLIFSCIILYGQAASPAPHQKMGVVVITWTDKI